MKHMETAFGYYGTKEIKGIKDNEVITNFFTELGFDGKSLKDETAWCSAFVNFINKVSCLEYTSKLNARSWVNMGVEVTNPEYGDVVVFWRESKDSWKGHVAFYINELDGFIYVLGGNQSNQVKISAYPKERLLTYRRLT